MSATEQVSETSTAVAIVESPHQPARQRFDQEQIDLIARTIAPGCSNDELALFVKVAERTGLDPFAKQIHALKRKVKNPDNGQWEERLSIQVGIDGFRLIAERTGQYQGRLGPYWCGDDGEWGINQDGKPKPWLSAQPPAAALVGIHKRGWREPLWAVARWTSYVQTVRDGTPNRMWSTMPDGQLGKCAEALALRGAFPAELSGIYSEDEMGQAQHSDPITDAGWADATEHEDHRHDTDAIVKTLSITDRKAVKEWVQGHTSGYKTLWTRAQAEDYRLFVALRDQARTAEKPVEAEKAPSAPATPPPTPAPTGAPDAAESGAGMDREDLIAEQVGKLALKDVRLGLMARSLATEGTPTELRLRLVEAMVAESPEGDPF